MKKLIYNWQSTELLRTEEATPICDQDFCDECGDCLACYGDELPADGHLHMWIEYEESPTT